MDRKTLSRLVATLTVSLALAAGTGWAQTIEIPISGMETLTTIDPGDTFVDADGITHIRGLIQISQIVGQDADGVPVTGVAEYTHNINIDMATGDGNVNTKISTELFYGDLAGHWRGMCHITTTGFVHLGSFVYSRGTDDFAGWHMRGTVTGVFGALVNTWEGHFQIPGGHKAAVEARTWSGVKDLFR